MALTQISTQGIKDGTISSADLADQSVTLAKLPHGTSSNDGKFLRANNGADPTFETVSSIGGSTGVDFDDNVKARFGTGNDLEIFHSGTFSHINDTAGSGLVINTDNLFVNTRASEQLAEFTANGSVELFFDNVKKFETTSYGVLSNQALKLNGNFLELNNNADVQLTLNKASTQLFSIRNNSTAGVHINTQNSAILAFGVSTGSNNGSVESDLRIVSGGNVQIPADNKKFQIGASQDLELYHSGSHSFIDRKAGGTGDIYVRLGTDNAIIAKTDAAVELYHDNSKKLETTSTGVTVTGDLLATGLFKNDTVGEGLHNTATGAKFFSNNSNDTHLEHGSNAQVKLSFISSSSTFRGAINGDANGMMILTGASGEEKGINCIANGATELYHNNSKKFETLSNGVQITGTLDVNGGGLTLEDNAELQFGANADLKIYHDSNNSLINASGTGNLIVQGASDIILRPADGEVGIDINANGSVELYHDNSKKFETVSDGISVTGNVTASSGLIIGAELNMIGNTGHKYMDINLGTNTFTMRGVSGGDQHHTTLATFTRGGAVELYFDNSKKFETTLYGAKINNSGSYGSLIVGSTTGDGAYVYLDGDANGDASGSDYGYIGMTNQGVIRIHNYKNEDIEFANNNTVRARFTSSGHFVPQANNTYDLGSSGARWQNIYTNDLNLSNEGSANDVDGTWGSYTIQEGAKDLFLVNKRNGKKYKFNLTEVS